MSDTINFDWTRADRIGIGEAVLCAGKTDEQIIHIHETVQSRGHRCLFTRLSQSTAGRLDGLDYHAASRTGIAGDVAAERQTGSVCIVCAGTSDTPVALEAARTLQFAGIEPTTVFDVGVAGLHRLTARLDEISHHRVVIVVAGMDAALASVVAGQVGSVVVAVPTSTGYGVARAGETALSAMLTSCAAGLSVVNIDNGFGAACVAIRCLNNLGD